MNHIRKIFLAGALVVLAGGLTAQNEKKRWFFGQNAGLDFNSSPPVPVLNIADSHEGTAAIADASTGVTLFQLGTANDTGTRYQVWDANQNLMSGLSAPGLYGNSSTTSGPVILKRPGACSEYYIFHIEGTTGGCWAGCGFYYSTIDMSANSGLGAVTSQNNFIWGGIVSEKLMATPHANGTDYWIVTHETGNQNFRAYQFSAAGLNMTPVISSVAPNHGASTGGVIGEGCFSPNGSKAAVGGGGAFYLYDFNNATGVFSNPLNLTLGASAYGVAFAPNGNKLYASHSGNGDLYQYDLLAGNIPASMVRIDNSFYIKGGIELAPDGKIYVAQFGQGFVGVIDQPDLLYPACNFIDQGVTLVNGTRSNLGMINFPSSYIPNSGGSFTLNSNSTPVSCNGGSNGSATVSASGGTAPYAYIWSPGNLTGSTVTGLQAGTYTVTITDAGGCSDTAIVIISQPAALSASVMSSDPLCSGGNTGTAGVSVTGGTPAYSYSWSPSGGSNATASGLSAQTYTVTITDANGCALTQTVTLNQPAPLNLGTSFTPANCGQSNGSATVNASGGTPGYTYLWSNGQTGSMASALASGVYTVSVTDANGCSASSTVSVLNSGGPSLTLSSQNNVSCNGDSNGSATVTASGGTAPYTYAWLPSGGNGPAATGLSAQSYTVTVSDANGCTFTLIVVITEPMALTASVSSLATCASDTASAWVTIQGGTAPYIYVWSPSGGSGTTATGLSSGVYTVTVTDANGCSASSSVTVSASSPPLAGISGPLTITPGNSATIIASGGGNYLWSSGETTSSINVAPSSSTEYCVTVTNGAGCSDSACVWVYVDLSCGELFIPNVFSPNNDQQNDVLRVYGGCIEEMNLRIYDRWGEKVFETDDPSGYWDGSYKGKTMNIAVFVYQLSAKIYNGEKVIKKGNITLIR